MKSNKNKVLHIAVPTPLRKHFDYLCETLHEEENYRGRRVRISFQNRELIGIILNVSDFSSYPKNKLKSVIEVIDAKPVIPESILALCEWAANYYQHGIGDVLETALPTLFRQGRELVLKDKDKFVDASINLEMPHVLNQAQQMALQKISQNKDNFNVFLLDGVTGSGKTEIYLQAIAKVVEQQKQVLVLVPEIGLTPQTIERFRRRFTVPVIALHSALTDKQRFNVWLQAQHDQPQIIIGTRSAIFTPFNNLGLIVVDEEHDLSFKQQEGFRYHARDLAIVRARDANIPIVLGSATPSLESLSRVRQEKYLYLQLPERAGSANLPTFSVIDIRNQYLDEGLSPSLIALMQQHLENNNQVMLFLNRRGYAPVFMCHGCGWMAQCKRCEIRMTYHHNPLRLHCHHCDSRKFIPKKCESCGNVDLQVIGLGTERLEEVLQKHFPNYSTVRIDRDTTQRKGSMEKILDDIHAGKHKILIGTQMLAKGHHFPNVTLVGIINADSGFFSSDFRSVERMGQLILQVAGRAGRVDKPGTVVIQTHHPENPLLLNLIHANYSQFAENLLQERKSAELPPYAYLAMFRAEAHNADAAFDFLQKVKELANANKVSLPIYGPMPAPMPKRAGRFRAQLLLHAMQRPQLQQFLRELVVGIETISGKSKVRWSLDVDPQEMF